MIDENWGKHVLHEGDRVVTIVMNRKRENRVRIL